MNNSNLQKTRNDPDKAIADDDADMWVSPPFSASNSLHRGLREMEENLRCSICGAFMKSPVSVDPCHHTFCSLCIQQHARACLGGVGGSNNYRRGKMDCPLCRVEITGTDINRRLQPNPNVEKIIQSFCGIRTQLKAVLVAAGNGTAVSSEDQTAVTEAVALTEQVAAETAQTKHSNNGRRKRGRQNYAEATDDDENSGHNSDANQDSDYEGEETPKAAKAAKKDDQTTPSKNNEQYQYREEWPKTIYGNMKKNKLKELCRSIGLPDHGNEQALKKRHQYFVTLYNSYCHSRNPKSQQEVVQEVKEWERNINKASMVDSGPAGFQQAFEVLKRQRKIIGESKDVKGGTHAKSGIAWFDDIMDKIFAKLIQEERDKLRANGKKSAMGSASNRLAKEETESTTGEETNNTSPPPASAAASASPAPGTSDSSASNGNPMSASGTCHNPSSTQMAYDPAAVAGIANNSAIFSPNAIMATPAVPKLFQPGSNAPSTISHKQSQQSVLMTNGVNLDPTLHIQVNTSHSSPYANHAPQRKPKPPTEAEITKTRHEAARLYALSETNCNKPKNVTENNDNKATKRSPTTLLDAGITKTRLPARAPAPAPNAPPTRRSGRSICGPWQCMVCTFHNTTRTWTSAKCEMCGNKRSSQGNHGAINENVCEPTVCL